MSQSMAELFYRDPLELTDEDISEIIAKLRENRAAFLANPAAAKANGPKKLTEKQEEAASLNLDIKL